MKYVWLVQDCTSMEVNKVFTTKKAAFADAKEYGKGRFKTVMKNSIYWYFTKDDSNEPACSVHKVPVIKVKR